MSSVARVAERKVCVPRNTNRRNKWLLSVNCALSFCVIGQATYQLELHRHELKVDNLDSGPDGVAGLEGRHEKISQLGRHGSPTATFGKSHDSVEGRDAERRKQDLVHGDALQGRPERGAALGHGERGIQQAEPAELNRRHDEAVAHEARQALKVEARGSLGGRRPGFHVVVVEFLDLDVVVLLLGGGDGHGQGAVPDGRDELRSRVGDAAEEGVGDHHGQDWLLFVRGVEARRQARDKSHFDEEDEGLEKRLGRGLAIPG